MIQPLWKTVWQFLKKVKHKINIYPTIPLLSQRLESRESKRILYTNVHSIIHTSQKDGNNSNVSEQMNG